MTNDLNRLAYIIGNNSYKDLKPLSGSANDADLMESALKQCGFLTQKFIDLSFDGFANKIYEFKRQCIKYNVALFYYAGHGFEFNGKNFLCPIDASLKSSDVERKNIDITNLVNEISKARDFVCIIILDCCRDIIDSNARGIDKTNSIIPNFINTGGTFVAYATTSGEDALEKNGNGLYTDLLHQYILEENKQIEQIFKDVRKELIAKTDVGGKNQISWEYSSLVNEFYFKEKNISYNCINDLAKEIIEKKRDFSSIVALVKEYCEKNGLEKEQISKITLDVLNEIDNILRENTHEKC